MQDKNKTEIRIIDNENNIDDYIKINLDINIMDIYKQYNIVDEHIVNKLKTSLKERNKDIRDIKEIAFYLENSYRKIRVEFICATNEYKYQDLFYYTIPV